MEGERVVEDGSLEGNGEKIGGNNVEMYNRQMTNMSKLDYCDYGNNN